jgi:hypothetical protein
MNNIVFNSTTNDLLYVADEKKLVTKLAKILETVLIDVLQKTNRRELDPLPIKSVKVLTCAEKDLIENLGIEILEFLKKNQGDFNKNSSLSSPFDLLPLDIINNEILARLDLNSISSFSQIKNRKIREIFKDPRVEELSRNKLIENKKESFEKFEKIIINLKLGNYLAEIELKGELIPEERLIKFFKKCPNIAKLNLFSSPSLSTQTFISFLPQIANLKTLYLDCSQLKSDTELSSLKTLPLKELRLSNYSQFLNTNLHHLPPTLETLELREFNNVDSTCKLKFNPLFYLPSLLPNLKNLKLRRPDNWLKNDYIHALPSTLESLAIGFSSNLFTIPILPKNLKKLKLIHCISLRELPTEWPNQLELLDLRFSDELRRLPKKWGECITSLRISRAIHNRSIFPLLTERIKEIKIQYDIKNDELINLIKPCTKLENLLVYSDQLTKEIFPHFPKTLKVLRIGNSSLAEAAKNQKWNVKEIDVDFLCSR